MVYSLSIKMLADAEEAKDIVQDTFIKVWQSIGSYDNRYSFSTWVYTICSRLCLDRIKKLRWKAPMADDIDVLENYVSDSNPERQLEGSEWVSVVKVLAQGLSNKQRLVFTLSQLEGLSTEEITEITGMDATQIKSNLSLARKSVREQLKKLGYE
jgi:RNA polymerase sigma-70 factor (ECF subfamily)